MECWRVQIICKSFKPRLAPYGPPWPCLVEITFKLSNCETFKLSSFYTCKLSRLAPYGPPWPCLVEKTLKLSNFKTFKVLNFQILRCCRSRTSNNSGALHPSSQSRSSGSELFRDSLSVYSRKLHTCSAVGENSARFEYISVTFDMSIFQLHSSSLYFIYF